MREYIIIASVISVVICVGSYVLGVQRPEGEKASVYQCGFVPFVDAHQRFEVRFYLVAILFLIFDLEIALLFPWALVLNVENYVIMMVFVGLLTIGLVYEWKRGGLN